MMEFGSPVAIRAVRLWARQLAGILSVACVVFAAQIPDVRGDVAADASDKDRLSWILDGVRERIDSLKSGEFTAEGSFVEHAGLGKDDDRDGPYRIDCVFSNGSYRLDRIEPGRLLKPIPDPGVPEQIDANGLRILSPGKHGRYETVANDVRLHVRSDGMRKAYWIEYEPTAVIVPHDHKIPLPVQPFDIRAIGFYGWLEFMGGESAEVMLSGLEAAPSIALSEEGSGVWKLEVNADNPYEESRWQILIDAEHGFTPREARRISRRRSSDADWITQQRSSIVWQDYAGVWVPESMEFVTGAKDAKVTRRLLLDFDWKQVNSVVDDAEFDPSALKVPDSIGIIDITGPKPIILRAPTVGRGEATVNPPANLSREDPDDRSAWLRRAMILGNLVALVALFAVVVWRVRRRSRQGN
jgi:hypothetical protein